VFVQNVRILRYADQENAHLGYYQEVKKGLAEIYSKYDLIPPGDKGLNVCMCRDIYLQDYLSDKNN
jgi:hypothetical protein